MIFNSTTIRSVPCGSAKYISLQFTLFPKNLMSGNQRNSGISISQNYQLDKGGIIVFLLDFSSNFVTDRVCQKVKDPNDKLNLMNFTLIREPVA